MKMLRFNYRKSNRNTWSKNKVCCNTKRKLSLTVTQRKKAWSSKILRKVPNIPLKVAHAERDEEKEK